MDFIFSGFALADGSGDTRTIAVLPEGTWHTDKYGEIDLSADTIDAMIAAFAEGVPPQGVFIDIDHDFGAAYGRVTKLARGTYTDPVSDEQLPALCAVVEFTSEGVELVDSGKYGYVSAAFGPYTDPRTGTKYPDVLRAVSLTNSPVLGNLGRVGEGAAIALSENVTGELTEPLPEEHEDAVPTEDEDDTRLAEPDDDSGEDPVADMLSRFDAVFAEADEVVRGTAGVRALRAFASETRKKLEALLTRKGGTNNMSDTDIMLTDEGKALAERAEAAEAKLAAIEAAKRTAAVNDALDKLSAKGLAEPARAHLEAILLAEDRDAILLSEGADAVSLPDALLAFAEAVEFVPVVTDTELTEQPNEPTVTLTDDERKIATQLGLTDAEFLAAKAAETTKEG